MECCNFDMQFYQTHLMFLPYKFLIRLFPLAAHIMAAIRGPLIKGKTTHQTRAPTALEPLRLAREASAPRVNLRLA
jgi:hypothetical protein